MCNEQNLNRRRPVRDGLTRMSALVVLLALHPADRVVFAEAESLSAEEVFRQQYPDALRRMERFFSEIEIIGTLLEGPPGEAAPSEYRVRFVSSAGASKYERQQLRPGQNTVVWCRNPDRYVFLLERASEVSTFAARRMHPKNAPVFDSTERYAHRHFKAPYTVFGVPISELMDHRDFSIQSVSSVERDGRRLVHVKYDFRPGTDLLLRSGELWLSPQEGWAVREYRSLYAFPSSPSRPGEITGLIDYDRMQDGVAIPRRSIVDQSFGGGSAREEFRFESVEHTRSPREEFTLTNYGLPEVEVKDDWAATNIGSPEGGGLSVRGWLLVINGMMLLAIVLLTWIRRRQPT